MANRLGMDCADKPGVAYEIIEHKPYVSEVFYNYLGDSAISLSAPVFYRDEFVGIVRWMIQLDRISERFVQSINTMKSWF